jgi:hypothetical protein
MSPRGFFQPTSATCTMKCSVSGRSSGSVSPAETRAARVSKVLGRVRIGQTSRAATCASFDDERKAERRPLPRRSRSKESGAEWSVAGRSVQPRTRVSGRRSL